MLSARQRNLIARELLGHPKLIAEFIVQHKWEELLALREFVEADVPLQIAQTDPALYRLLRHQITEFNIHGWRQISIPTLKELVRISS